MSRLLLILTILISIVISGCTTATDESLKPAVTQTHQNESPKVDVLACKEKGGVIKKVCMLNSSFCVQKHLDAGKKCSDSSECVGDCRIEN